MRIYQDRDNESFQSMTRLSLVAFLCELPNFIITAVSAILSGTPVVWVDTVNSLGETLHCFLVYLVTKVIRKENGDKYNFGTDRFEVFASFVCDCLVCMGLLCVFAGAVYGILSPSYPADTLFLFVLIKVSNSVWDAAFLLKALKASAKTESRLIESEVKNYTKALVFDVLIGVIVAVTYAFRAQLWVCYVNPIISMILIVFFFAVYAKRIKATVGELTDVSLPLQNQDEIYDIVLSHTAVIKRLEEINCRRLNGKTHIEICVTMHDDVAFSAQRDFLAAVREEIAAVLPDAKVKLIIGQNMGELF